MNMHSEKWDFLAMRNFLVMRMFRMTRSGFQELFNKISPYMHDTNTAMANLSSGSPISTEAKLYATLRWLTESLYLDICFAWGLLKSAFFSTEDFQDSGIIAETRGNFWLQVSIFLTNPSSISDRTTRLCLAWVKVVATKGKYFHSRDWDVETDGVCSSRYNRSVRAAQTV